MITHTQNYSVVQHGKHAVPYAACAKLHQYQRMMKTCLDNPMQKAMISNTLCLLFSHEYVCIRQKQ